MIFCRFLHTRHRYLTPKRLTLFIVTVACVIVCWQEISMACVVAQPHPRWDERPVAIVIAASGDGGSVDKAKVLEHVATKFAKFEVPDDVLTWSEIPMTSTGKLDKKNVRAKLEAEGYVLPSLAKSML